MGVSVLVGAGRASEEGAVGRRGRRGCGRAPLAKLEILCRAVLVDGRPHRGGRLERIAADSLVGLPGTPPAEMACSHLLAKVAELPESHRVMIVSCVRPALMMSRHWTSILLRTQSAVSSG